ncbi:hypothetical protein EDD18DRAFT_1185333, partial [Armillaria luteobubalina]
MMVRWNNGRAHNIPRNIFWSCEEAIMVVKRIDYDVAHSGKILSMTPYVLANQTLKNNSDDEQEMSFDFSKTVIHIL